MAYQINGTSIPSSIYNSGKWLPPDPEELAQNGQGDSLAGRIRYVRWSWASLSKTDYEWWTQTILANALSLRCSARLPNVTGTETAYTTVIVRKPKADEMHNVRYFNVQIVIEILD